MLLEILETFNYEPQLAMPFPLVAMALVGIGGQIAAGIKASNDAKRAQRNANTLKGQLLDLENARQDVFDSSDDIRALGDTLSNPYANLSVATQAAEMQAEQTDIALANTLDTVRAGGYGAGGATALAQAAARSKQGISASIEQQEVNNEKLRVQGEDRLQTQKLSIEEAAINAEGQAWARQEGREMTQLDRKQAEIDQALGQQMQSKSDMMGAFTGAASGLTSLGMSGMGTSTFTPKNYTGPQGGPPTIQQPNTSNLGSNLQLLGGNTNTSFGSNYTFDSIDSYNPTTPNTFGFTLGNP
tara:strand:- start:1174 stop:2073 length:900 start_codon:yes stop_codon:yes gene_type:complete